jgi:hypothetical protein
MRGKWILLGPSPEPEQDEYVKPVRAEWSHAKGDKKKLLCHWGGLSIYRGCH